MGLLTSFILKPAAMIAGGFAVGAAVGAGVALGGDAPESFSLPVAMLLTGVLGAMAAGLLVVAGLLRGMLRLLVMSFGVLVIAIAACVVLIMLLD